MKSIINNEEVQQEVTFPCLMKSTKSGNVILFTREGFGFVVYLENEAYKLGESSALWEMDSFKPFNGTIELSN